MSGTKQKTKNTGPELALRKELNRIDLKGYRLHHRIELPQLAKRRQHTTPDVVFVGEKVAIFVQGCYWHSCDLCGYRDRPSTPAWRKKQADARARDERHQRGLVSMGYRVFVHWEHEDPVRGALAVAEVLRLNYKPGVYSAK